MLRDILKPTPQVQAVSNIITHIAPDILLLQGIDFDTQLHGAKALQSALFAQGLHYDHIFALPPNTGIPTGVDLNGDGTTDGPADAQGYGKFRGADGMLLMSRWPISRPNVQDHSALLWRDLPDAQLPYADNTPFPSAKGHAIQRLSSTGHWEVPVVLPSGRAITLLAFSATPPVFDGPEDRNGLRNADEILLWQHRLNGDMGPAPQMPAIVIGVVNLDPNQGQGRHTAIRTLLNHPHLQDPHQDAGPTVDWSDPVPGDLRVDYVLPSREFEVTDAGVFWPRPDAPDHALLSHKDTAASRHRMVWVDLAF